MKDIITPGGKPLLCRYSWFVIFVSFYVCVCMHMYECVFARVHVCAREGPTLMSNLESPLVAFHLTTGTRVSQLNH